MKQNKSISINEYNDESLNIYIQEMHKYPVLSEKDEQALAIKAHDGDASARDTLIMSNLRVAFSIAKSWASDSLPLRDVMSQAIEGLINGVDAFNPARENRMYSFLWWRITERVQAYSEAMRSSIALTHRQCNLLAKTRNLRQQLEQTYGALLDDSTMTLLGAEELGCDASELTMLQMAEKSISLESPLSGGDDDDDDDVLTLADTLSSDDEQEAHNARMEQLYEGMSLLPERMQKVLKKHFGFEGENMRQKDIAAELNVSPETVRLDKSRALKQLLQWFKATDAAEAA